MAQPPQTPQTPPIPEILSEDQWRELKQKGEVTPYQSNFGTVLVLLLGSKGIGKKSLRMKVSYRSPYPNLRQALMNHAALIR